VYTCYVPVLLYTIATCSSYCTLATFQSYCALAALPSYCTLATFPSYCALATFPSYCTLATFPSYCMLHLRTFRMGPDGLLAFHKKCQRQILDVHWYDGVRNNKVSCTTVQGIMSYPAPLHLEPNLTNDGFVHEDDEFHLNAISSHELRHCAHMSALWRRVQWLEVLPLSGLWRHAHEAPCIVAVEESMRPSPSQTDWSNEGRHGCAPR